MSHPHFAPGDRVQLNRAVWYHAPNWDPLAQPTQFGYVVGGITGFQHSVRVAWDGDQPSLILNFPTEALLPA